MQDDILSSHGRRFPHDINTIVLVAQRGFALSAAQRSQCPSQMQGESEYAEPCIDVHAAANYTAHTNVCVSCAVRQLVSRTGIATALTPRAACSAAGQTLNDHM